MFARTGCGACHQVRGSGAPGSSDLARIPAATGFFGLAAAMWNHVPQMSARMREMGVERPRLSPRELEALLAFLFTAQYFDGSGDPAIGERLFSARYCVRCHAVGGAGGQGGPPLDSVGRASAPVLVAATMWNHGLRMAELIRVAATPYPIFAEGEFDHIASYLTAAARGQGTLRERVVPGTPERGERLFADRGCTRCHASGRSMARRAPALGTPSQPRSLTEFASRMWNHAPRMWEAMGRERMTPPRLGGQDMADIVAHLFTRHYFDRSRGDPARGRHVVERKGCLGCHSLHGRGGKAAPDLASSNVVASSTGHVAALWNQARFMETEARRRGRSWPRLDSQELADLVAFLARMGRGTSGRR